jgi:hypothetical protein
VSRKQRQQPRNGSHTEDDAHTLPVAVGEPPPNKMDATEKRYALHLDEQLRDGRILWWAREPVSIRLARGSSYVPDFLVMLADRSLEVHEVKQRGGQNFHARTHHHPHRDSYAKWKIAAARLPVRFYIVWPESGEWKRRAPADQSSENN